MKLFALSALVVASLSAPAFADAVAPGRNLAIVESVADFSLDAVQQWAANSAPNASLAAPVVPNAFLIPVRDPRRSVETGMSEGAATRAEADAQALAQCEAIRPPNYLPCVIVARVTRN